MLQTGYTGVTAFTKGLPYDAGWCEFYFTPIENISQWPTVLPLTQELDGEPILKVGTSWYGPIIIANPQLGYKESQSQSAAGPFYKAQLDGFYPGDGRASRINLENMPYHRYAIVGKQRAGGIFLLLGGADCGLDFSHNYSTGRGGSLALTEFSFTGELLNKAMVLPTFGSQTSTPMPGYTPPSSVGGGSTPTINQTEIIEFTSQTTLTILWNSTRKGKFGSFPIIEVWFKDGIVYTLANVPISVDAAPPDTAMFTIDLTGSSDGFVVIK